MKYDRESQLYLPRKTESSAYKTLDLFNQFTPAKYTQNIYWIRILEDFETLQYAFIGKISLEDDPLMPLRETSLLFRSKEIGIASMIRSQNNPIYYVFTQSSITLGEINYLAAS